MVRDLWAVVLLLFGGFVYMVWQAMQGSCP